MIPGCDENARSCDHIAYKRCCYVEQPDRLLGIQFISTDGITSILACRGSYSGG